MYALYSNLQNPVNSRDSLGNQPKIKTSDARN